MEQALEIGKTVEGQIDWEERFSKMQQHSGEHIVSGIVHSRFGYDNVGFHMGTDAITIDFNGPITKEELREIERKANEAVATNLEVQVLYPSKEEKAARIGVGLVSNHAFVDGNKRIGMYVLLTFLEVNGIPLEATDEEVVDVGLRLAEGKMQYEELLQWIKDHE